jgi:hypothetical protein
MEIAKLCPKDLADIMREAHKLELDAIEAGITVSVSLNHLDCPYFTVYVHDPKPRKGRKEIDSFQFNPPRDYCDHVKENAKAYNAMLKYYERMKAKVKK